MQSCSRLVSVAVVLFVIAGSAHAAGVRDEPDPDLTRWERAHVQLGAFFSAMDSSFRFAGGDSGLGVTLDVEDALGLDTSQTAFRFDGAYRFTRNRKHRLDLTWFRMNRSADRTILPDEEIQIPDPDDPDNVIVISDTTIFSKLNFDIIKLKYKYSFLLDDRLDLFFGGGFYVMPIEFGVGQEGQDSTEESITAPLPVLSLGINLAVSKNWYVRQEFDLMYLRISGFTGRINDISLGVERRLSKRIALGLGVESLQINIESSSESDYPGVDFVGEVEFGYTGLQLYVRGRF